MTQQSHSQVCISKLNPHLGLLGKTHGEFISRCFCRLEATCVFITWGIATSMIVINYYMAGRSSGLAEHSNTINSTRQHWVTCRNRISEAQSYLYNGKYTYTKQEHLQMRGHTSNIGGGGNLGKGRRKGGIKGSELFKMKQRTYTCTNKQKKTFAGLGLQVPLIVELDYCTLLLLRLKKKNELFLK